MSFSPALPRIAVLALAALLVGTPSFAHDSLGSAGPIRVFGDRPCSSDFAAIMRGECDPPEVDSNTSPQQRSQQRVERARRLISIPRLEQARKDLDAAIADDPRNTAARLLRGRLSIPGSIDGAMKDVNAVLAIDPDLPDALATRAFVLRDVDNRAALRDVTKAIALDPKNGDAFWIRAMVLSTVESLDEAERDLNSAIALEADNARALMLRAQIRMRMGKYGEARSDASAVLALQHSLGALQLRAVAQARSGDYAGAIDDLNEVLGKPGDAIRPHPVGRQFADLYVQRALALTRTGKRAEARQDLDTIVAVGGIRAILQMQLYLRSHGFPDVKLDGLRSDRLDDALQACFVNDACGRGLTITG